MLKKLLLVAAVAAVPVAQACSYGYDAGKDMTAVIKQNGGGFGVSDRTCKMLEAAGMSFNIQAAATVLGGVSIGWVSVGIIDRNNVISNAYRTVTNVNAKEPGSMDRAEQLMYTSLVSAVRDLDVAKAIAEVHEARRKAK